MMILIEDAADRGFAVRRNGTILLRTATNTAAQAMGNGLVLLFGADPQMIDWADPDRIEVAWAEAVRRSIDTLQIVECRAVAIAPAATRLYPDPEPGSPMADWKHQIDHA